MKTTFSEIAHFRTGVFEKSRAFGSVYYLQARHFDATRQALPTVVPELDYSPKLEKHVLQKGDLLVVAKGFEHFAAVFEELNAPAVASSTFIVARVTRPDVLPEYLAWFINHPATQAKLSGAAKGTSMPAISISELANLEILLPDLPTQTKVMNVEKLRIQEKQLLHRIEWLRDAMREQQIFDLLNKQNHV